MSNFTNPAVTLAILHDYGCEIIAIGSVMLTVAFGAVVLRFASKSLNVKKFGHDDLFMGFALVCYLAMESLVLRAVDMGRRAATVSSPEYTDFAKLVYTVSLLYWSVIAFSIISLLFLYRRIFAAHRFFSIASHTLVGLTLAWWISGTVCEGVGMRPVQADWNLQLVGQYYVDYIPFWLTSMVVELALEIATLVLPVREIAKLQLENRKKALVVAMFCMGAFVIATGIVRITLVWRQSDKTSGIIWLSIHSAVIIVSACLPTYGPLLTQVLGVRLTSSDPQMAYNLDKFTGGRSPKRAISRAPHNLRIDPTLNRNSLDGILLGGPALTGLGSFDTQDNHDLDKQKKHISIGETSSLKHGLTKQWSIPSPTSTEGDWGPAAFFGSETSGQKWPLGFQGPRTKRAELEYKKQKKEKRKSEEKI